jgi:hypothetical protein
VIKLLFDIGRQVIKRNRLMIPSDTIQEGLVSSDPDTQLAALRKLKNAIIGHKEKKESYLTDTVVIPVLNILSDGATVESQTQASVILGSFAYGTDETVQKLLKYPVVATILNTLDSCPSADLSAGCLRILVTILQSQPNLSLLHQYSNIVNLLDRLLSMPSTACSVMLQSCKLIPLLSPTRVTLSQLAPLSQCLAARIAILMRQYAQPGSKALPLEAALSALSHIITPTQAKELLASSPPSSLASGTIKLAVSTENFISGLIHFTKVEDPGIRLTAVELLAKLQKHAVSEQQREIMTRPLLPTLVPILDLLGSDPRVSLTLSYICRDNEKCAAMAVEVGVIKKIMAVLKSADINSWREDELIENNLLALAGIGIHKDSFRLEIVENGALAFVIKIISLKPASASNTSALRKVKVAACHVLRALSRSVTLLRTSLASTDIVEGIVDLLNMESEEQNQSVMDSNDETFFEEHKQQLEDQLEVKTAVMAAICNLILEFSPIQKTIFDKGVLDLIIDSAHSEYPPLRLNSIWALKHAIFEATKDMKTMVLAKLKPEYLLELCNDPMLAIQEQSLDFIRNFLCRNFDGVDYIFETFGRDTLFNLIEEKLDLYEDYPQIMIPAIYILVHIAAGTDAHRDIVAQRDSVLTKLIPLMTHDQPEVRTACVWLVINLTWIEEHGNFPRNEACKIRAEKLIRLGFKDKLDERSRDPTLDVRERIKTALFQLENLVGGSSSGFLEGDR